mmetsp:Transcript_42759/g.134937  ORF Transcript_42759/g.134937 Transcript_42759/m.134937 type:complete len:267 (+) Transcript_42759:113-913(+)
MGERMQGTCSLESHLASEFDHLFVYLFMGERVASSIAIVPSPQRRHQPVLLCRLALAHRAHRAALGQLGPPRRVGIVSGAEDGVVGGGEAVILLPLLQLHLQLRLLPSRTDLSLTTPYSLPRARAAVRLFLRLQRVVPRHRRLEATADLAGAAAQPFPLFRAPTHQRRRASRRRAAASRHPPREVGRWQLHRSGRLRRRSSGRCLHRRLPCGFLLLVVLVIRRVRRRAQGHGHHTARLLSFARLVVTLGGLLNILATRRLQRQRDS